MRALILIVILFSLNPYVSKADSPVTSTPFHTAYNDVEIVNYASTTGYITEDIANFLLEEKNPLDVKAAIINALSWDIAGKENVAIFKEYIEKKHKKKFNKIKQDKLNYGELMCLGYLTVMDNYFNPEAAIPYLEKALMKNKKSYTINMLTAITKAQLAMDNNWCKVWRLAEEVEENNSLVRDMRPAAIDIIMNYMILYKDDCK